MAAPNRVKAAVFIRDCLPFFASSLPHARIEREWLGWADGDAFEIRMEKVEQNVVLLWYEHRGHP